MSMTDPTILQLLEKADCRYTLVVETSKRARQLIDGVPPLIDAKDNLSVQVHPDNEYALRVEGEYGKTEMWYIVDCEPGAKLIYGFE